MKNFTEGRLRNAVRIQNPEYECRRERNERVRKKLPFRKNDGVTQKLFHSLILYFLLSNFQGLDVKRGLVKKKKNTVPHMRGVGNDVDEKGFTQFTDNVIFT